MSCDNPLREKWTRLSPNERARYLAWLTEKENVVLDGECDFFAHGD
jgi:hypothetical protein